MPPEVDAIVERLAHTDLGERLRAISELRSALEGIEAELVAAAVAEGWSWTRIGAALGISKQAAHAKHRRSPAVEAVHREGLAGPTAGRPEVSPDARLAVRLAREEAAALGQRRVGTEHLLLGVLRMEDSDATDALRECGVSLSAARSAAVPTIERIPQAGGGGSISPLARQVLERSLREALSRGEGKLGAEGLLAAVLRDSDGGAARTLERLGIEPADVVARLNARA